jgi:hypothetical protein
VQQTTDDLLGQFSRKLEARRQSAASLVKNASAFERPSEADSVSEAPPSSGRRAEHKDDNRGDENSATNDDELHVLAANYSTVNNRATKKIGESAVRVAVAVKVEDESDVEALEMSTTGLTTDEELSASASTFLLDVSSSIEASAFVDHSQTLDNSLSAVSDNAAENGNSSSRMSNHLKKVETGPADDTGILAGDSGSEASNAGSSRVDKSALSAKAKLASLKMKISPPQKPAHS